MSALDWLLEDDAPGVQYFARLRLLGESPDSRTMKSLRRRCNDYPPVAKMLAAIDRSLGLGERGKIWGMSGNYDKYRGAYWTLIFLADLHADGRDPRIRRLAEHVLATQLENGAFSPSETPRFEIVCLTANILRALVLFGYGDDPRIIRGYRRLAERILPHGGVPCIVLENCLHTSCKMTLPQTLRCLAAAPPGVPRGELSRLRSLLIDQLRAVRIFRYVRPDVAEFHEAVRRRPKAVLQRTIRLNWLNEHPVPNDRLVPKPGWLRFGFPRSYNPDLLEAMLALTELYVPHDPVFDESLDHIEKKRGSDGRWKLDASLNGKMLADIEKKGRPSKWITLRAMMVLGHFGRVSQ